MIILDKDATVRRTRLVVAGLCAVVLFFHLGKRSLNEGDEGRYAGIGWEMTASGDWLTPRLNGFEHLAKPPLTYWAVAAGMKLFGVNEFAARLPAALAAIGTLLFVFGIVRRAADESTALWAVLILVSSGLFYVMARVITPDMLLTCWVTGSVWALWRWYDAADKGFGQIVWFYIFWGLGMITKGPVAIVLALFAVAGLKWRNPQWRLRQMGWGWGLLVMLAIAAPWFVMLAWRRPELWDYFLLREVVERVATKTQGRAQPWWFFLPVLAGGFLPWTFLLPTLTRMPRLTGKRRGLLRLCGAWVVLGLLLFSVSQSKLASYVLPLTPPLAMLTALVITAHVTTAGSSQRTLVNWTTAGAVAAAVASIGAGVFAHLRYGLPLTHCLLLVGVVTVSAVGCAVALGKGRPRGALVALSAMFLASAVVIIAVLPGMERSLGPGTSARFVAEPIRQADPTGRAPVVSLNVFLQGLPLYLRRPVIWYYPKETRRHAADCTGIYEFTCPPDDAANLLLEPGSVTAIAAKPQLAFFIAEAKNASAMVHDLRLNLHEWARIGKCVLFANQPPPPTLIPNAIP